MRVQDIEFGKAVSVEVECYGPSVDTPELRSKYDGSLGVGGVEFTLTNVHTDSGVSFPELGSAITEDIYTVNRQCGLHVHVDLRDVDAVRAKEIYMQLIRLSRVLKLGVPISRHENRYCRWRRNDNAHSNRYSAINFQAYRKFKTIEFRCQSGSVNKAKIEGWANLCYELVQWAKTSTGTVQLSWKAFLAILSPEARNWVLLRRTKLYHKSLFSVVQQYVETGQLVYQKSDESVLRELTGTHIGTATRPERTPRQLWLGYSKVSVLRTLGANGFSVENAAHVCRMEGILADQSTLSIQIRNGQRGIAGAPIPAHELERLRTLCGLSLPF